jgi:hypothetical protein
MARLKFAVGVILNRLSDNPHNATPSAFTSATPFHCHPWLCRCPQRTKTQPETSDQHKSSQINVESKPYRRCCDDNDPQRTFPLTTVPHSGNGEAGKKHPDLLANWVYYGHVQRQRRTLRTGPAVSPLPSSSRTSPHSFECRSRNLSYFRGNGRGHAYASGTLI